MLALLTVASCGKYFGMLLVACCIGACCLLHVALAHVACCMLHRRMLLVACCIGDAWRATHALLDWAKGGLCSGRAALRCARAQDHNGGVLSMDKGAALFDAVAISDTEAPVRSGAGRGVDVSWADAYWGGCRRTWCGANCGVAWLRRLCTVRRRDSHGRWGRHVQGRHDHELRGGACAPIAFARRACAPVAFASPTSRIGKLLRYAVLLRTTVGATWWARPLVQRCCTLQYAGRCMLRAVARPMARTGQALCGTWCMLYVVC